MRRFNRFERKRESRRIFLSQCRRKIASYHSSVAFIAVIKRPFIARRCKYAWIASCIIQYKTPVYFIYHSWISISREINPLLKKKIPIFSLIFIYICVEYLKVDFSRWKHQRDISLSAKYTINTELLCMINKFLDQCKFYFFFKVTFRASKKSYINFLSIIDKFNCIL